jgi:hypothetical protein
MTKNSSYERNQEAVLKKLTMNLAEYTRRLGGIECNNINIADSDEISEQFQGMLESVGGLEKAVEKILATSTKPEMPKIEKKSYTTLVYGTGGADSSYEEDLQERGLIISQVKDMLLEQKVDLMFKEASNRLINIIEDENFDPELQNLRLKLMTILLSSPNYDRLEYLKEEISSTKADGFSSGKLMILSALETMEIPYSYIKEYFISKTSSQILYLSRRLENDSRYLVIQKLRKEYGIDNAILIFIENSLVQSLEYLESSFAIVSKKLFSNSYEVNIKRIEDSFELLLLVPKKLLSDKIFELLEHFLEIENVRVLRLALDTMRVLVEGNAPDLAEKYFKIAESFYENSKNSHVKDCARTGLIEITRTIPSVARNVFVRLKKELEELPSPVIVRFLGDLLEVDHSLATETSTLILPYLENPNPELVSETITVISACIKLKPDLGSLNLTNQALALLNSTNKWIKVRALRLLENLILFYLEEMFQKKQAIYGVAEFINDPDEHIRDEAIFVMTCTAKKHPKLFPLVLSKFAASLIENIRASSNIHTIMEALEHDLIGAKIGDSGEILEKLHVMLSPIKDLERKIQDIIAEVKKHSVAKL